VLNTTQEHWQRPAVLTKSRDLNNSRWAGDVSDTSASNLTGQRDEEWHLLLRNPKGCGEPQVLLRGMKCTVMKKKMATPHEDSEGKYSSLCFYPPTQKTTPAYRNLSLPDLYVLSACRHGLCPWGSIKSSQFENFKHKFPLLQSRQSDKLLLKWKVFRWQTHSGAGVGRKLSVPGCSKGASLRPAGRDIAQAGAS